MIITIILAALAGVLILEGAAYAVAPDFMVRMAAQLREMGRENLRTAGLMAMALGVALLLVVLLA